MGMINITRLEIVHSEMKLYIDAEIKTEVNYADVYFLSITIDNQNTYNGVLPSQTPVYSEDFNPSVDKTISLVIDLPAGLPLYQDVNSLYLIRINTQGAPTFDTPCALTVDYTYAAVYDSYYFYTASMSYVNELSKNCNIPAGFLDSILVKQAIDYSIALEDYTNAVKLWGKFFDDEVVSVIGCGCNG